MDKLGTWKQELATLDFYKKQYEKKPTAALERIIKKQQARVTEAVNIENKTKVKELTPNEPLQINVIKMEPVKMPELEITVMEGEKVKKSRSEIPRLRKKLLNDITRLNKTIGIHGNTMSRMIRQAETGTEKTLLKLVKELQDKYETKYDIKMKSKMK